MPQAERCELSEVVWQRIEVELPDRLELGVGGPARTNEVRVICIREAIRVGPDRRQHRALLEHEHGVRCTGGDECVRNGFRSFGVRDRMTAAIEDAQLGALTRGDGREEVRSFELGGPNLEMWVARSAERPRPQKRAPEIGAPAAFARQDTLRRVLERAV